MARMDVAGAVQNVESVIAAFTSWQSICGVGDATAAAKRIYQGGTEIEPDDTYCPCIILRVDPLNTDWFPSTTHGKLTVEMVFELSVPADDCRTLELQYKWVWTQLSALLADFNSAGNDDGALMLHSIQMPLPPGPIDPDENFGRIEWGFIISLVLDFI